MKKFFTWIIIITVIAGGIGGFLWLRTQRQTQQQSENILRTGEVIRGDLDITVSASGNVAINDKIDLRFKQTGTVATLTVLENERVNAGQVLAQLETKNLERAVRQAEIALEQAQLNLTTLTKPASDEDLELARIAYNSAAQALEVARLAKITTGADANAMVVQAQRARENAHKDDQIHGTDKTEDVYENALEQERIARLNAEVMRKQAQDQWFSTYKTYQQTLFTLTDLQEGPDENRIEQAQLQINQAELNLEQAQKNLADAVLTAPFDGIVADINLQQGVLAPTGLPAITMVDDSAYYIEVAVDEIDISAVAIDQAVEVTLDAYPDTILQGTVQSIAPAPINLGGIIAYQIRIYIADNNDIQIRDGMTANVIISTSQVQNIILLPNWAIRTDQTDNSIYCYRIENDQPIRVNITTGQRNDTYTEITSGLEPGMTIALVSEEREIFGSEPPQRPGR